MLCKLHLRKNDCYRRKTHKAFGLVKSEPTLTCIEYAYFYENICDVISKEGRPLLTSSELRFQSCK